MSDRNNLHAAEPDESTEPEQSLTCQELADRWRVSVRTIQRYIQNGDLPAEQLPGGGYRIKPSDARDTLRVLRRRVVRGGRATKDFAHTAIVKAAS